MTNPTEAGPTMPTPSGPLDYAPRPPRLTGRRVVGVILLTIATAMTVVGMLWREPIQMKLNGWYAKWQVNRLQTKCMAYVAPEGQVVYEEDPLRAALLAKEPGYRAVQANAVTQTNTTYATTHPIASPPPVVHVPELWAKFATFYDVYDEIQRDAPGLAFMHERTSPGGKRMLVCVAAAMEAYRPFVNDWEAWQRPLRWGMRRSLYAWAIEPGSGRTPIAWGDVGTLAIDGPGGTEGVTFFSDDPAAPIGSPFPLRLYAGKIDPDDVSRFTIDYELTGIGHRGTIIGTLKDDGTVCLAADAGGLLSGLHGMQNPERTWKVPTTRPAQPESKP